MPKRLSSLAIVFAIFALSVIALHPLATRPIGFIEQLGRVRYDDTITMLPISEIESIALISPNSKDESQNLTDDEIEQLTDLLEHVELKGKYGDFSTIPDGCGGIMFDIRLTSGEDFKFCATAPVYIVDSQEIPMVYYTGQYPCCSAILDLYENLVEKYFPGCSLVVG